MSSREGGGGRLEGGRLEGGRLEGGGGESQQRETASKCEHQRQSQISDRPFRCMTVTGCMRLMAEMMMLEETVLYVIMYPPAQVQLMRVAQ